MSEQVNHISPEDPFGEEAPGLALRGWLTDPGTAGTLATLVHALHGVNSRLWSLEDAIRIRSLPAPKVRELKWAIDADDVHAELRTARC